MAMFVTIESSLRADDDVRRHESRAAAVEYAVALLGRHGWQPEIARAVLNDGVPAMLEDDGDDWTIRVEEVR